MGIRGLSTYISEHSDLFLKPYKLCNIFLVVDGNCIASHLYEWVMKSDSLFGGDYDEFYKVIKHFFNNLRKCHVTPLVLFDGGYEEKKLKTVFSRFVLKMFTLRTFAKTYSKLKFFPLFMKQTFFEVMDDMGIFCYQCELEADIEIAAVARALGCPVLSYDSDFYIYDVLYIPFSSVCNEILKSDNENNKAKVYLDCLIYDVNNFVDHLDGFDKSLLPIAATLLGNDYVESSVFQKFFNHICIPKSKKQSYSQRKIHGLFEWLKEENVESAIKLILSHLNKKSANVVMNAINRSIKEYSALTVSPSLFDKLNKVLVDKNILNSKLEKGESQTCLHSDISNSYYDCKISKFVVDMVRLKSYYSPLQVEYIHQQSSHLYALDIINAIYKIVSSLHNESKHLKLYLSHNKHYTVTRIGNDGFLDNFNFKNILNKPLNIKLKLICETLMLSDEEIDTIKCFSGSWALFVTCFLYWIRRMNNSVSLAHIHALILMAVCNQIAQKKVGYFRNTSKFSKKKGSLLEELSGTEIEITPEEDLSFKELLEKVTMYECLKLQQSLISFRQTQDESKKIQHYVLTIHLFACFQSCLFHLIQLNTLLNFPLPHLKISEYYSGTLLFNFYFQINKKSDVGKFETALLEDYPNIARVFKFILEKLNKFSMKVDPAMRPKRHRKRKKKNKKVKEETKSDEIINSNSQNESDYDGENNRYALLSNLN